MGSFDYKTISIAVVIALIVGAGAGYMVGNSPVSSLMEEKDWLEAEYDSLYLAFQSLEVELDEAEFNIIGLNRTILVFSERYADMIFIDMENQELIQQVIDLESEITSLQNAYQNIDDDYEELQENYEILQADFEEINQSYAILLNFRDLIVIDSYVQSIEYNISAGTEKTWEFLIPEYSIIWEAKISFSGIKVIMSHAWRRGEERVFVGSSGISLTYKDSADIVYYGVQEHLWGTITVDYYQDETDPNKLWVMGNIMTNLPTISREAHAYIDTISPEPEPEPEPEGNFVGSVNSDVYHKLTCRYVKMINEENKIYFFSSEEARAAGYRPCKVCNPP